MVGTTVVIGATKEKPLTGRKADLVQAAYLASEGTLNALINFITIVLFV